MKRILIAVVASAGLPLPVPASAPAKTSPGTPRAVASQTCQSERAGVGRKTFRHRYGARSMRVCIRRHVPDANRAVSDATAQCNLDLQVNGETGFLDSWDNGD